MLANKEVTRVEFPQIPQAKEKTITRKRVAAYARVSTERDKQENSLQSQKDYFTKYIKSNPKWKFAGLYVDDGVSGLSYHNREGFRNMVEDALNGKIDMIITKSLSRFARNTVDSLITIRKLKAAGVSVFFSKENIDTLDANGEFLITLLSSFAEEESRSISENITWAIRHRFSKGEYSMPYSFFLGYQKGADGKIVINESEAKIVRFIYMLALEGRCGNDICGILQNSGILSPGGSMKWQISTVESILSNEKYKGDARLQKQFTIDFMTKKMKQNNGEVPQYYVKNGHPAIIREDAWGEVQGLKNKDVQTNHASGSLTNKIICGNCGGLYGRKIWHSTTTHEVVWECINKKAGRTKCRCCHIYDDKLRTATALAVKHLFKLYPKTILECAEIWAAALSSGVPCFEDSAISVDDSMIRILIISIKVTTKGNLVFHFLDGHSFRYSLHSQTPNGSPGKVEQQHNHKKIIEMRRSGCSAKQISDMLGISINTVRSYLKRNRCLVENMKPGDAPWTALFNS